MSLLEKVKNQYAKVNTEYWFAKIEEQLLLKSSNGSTRFNLNDFYEKHCVEELSRHTIKKYLLDQNFYLYERFFDGYVTVSWEFDSFQELVLSLIKDVSRRTATADFIVSIYFVLEDNKIFAHIIFDSSKFKIMDRPLDTQFTCWIHQLEYKFNLYFGDRKFKSNHDHIKVNSLNDLENKIQTIRLLK